MASSDNSNCTSPQPSIAVQNVIFKGNHNFIIRIVIILKVWNGFREISR